MAKFVGKILIKGQIEALTGLHIGGNSNALDIGGVDKTVIKTSRDKTPFIPGSSLKGKLRSLMAREEGIEEISRDEGTYIADIFGYTGDYAKRVKAGKVPDYSVTPTRLLVRDAFLDKEDFEQKFRTHRYEMYSPFTEDKAENTIDRKTGSANNFRQLERVPPGAKFDFCLIYNVYDDELNEMEKQSFSEIVFKCDLHMSQLRKCLKILEDDYLGGNGSRGYGRVCFRNPVYEIKNLDYYMKGKEKAPEYAFFDDKDTLRVSSQFGLTELANGEKNAENE